MRQVRSPFASIGNSASANADPVQLENPASKIGRPCDNNSLQPELLRALPKR